MVNRKTCRVAATSHPTHGTGTSVERGNWRTYDMMRRYKSRSTNPRERTRVLAAGAREHCLSVRLAETAHARWCSESITRPFLGAGWLAYEDTHTRLAARRLAAAGTLERTGRGILGKPLVTASRSFGNLGSRHPRWSLAFSALAHAQIIVFLRKDTRTIWENSSKLRSISLVSYLALPSATTGRQRNRGLDKLV
jgi:hypothetical protein